MPGVLGKCRRGWGLGEEAMDAGSSPFPANRCRDSCHHQELEGELTAESVYQQLRQALPAGSEGLVDPFDLLLMAGNLPFQALLFGFNRLQALQ